MLLLGIHGSPRKKGNSAFLLSEFIKEAENLGAETEIIRPSELNITPCKGCSLCEKKGECVINDDDMAAFIYDKLQKADIIVISSPIFFYSFPSQIKSLIDRSQTLWSRKYKLKLKDPKSESRLGFMLALGATKGKNLFEGSTLTAKYFFDAVGAKYSGSLTYRQIENPGDMAKHPSVLQDVKDEAKKLISNFSI